MDIRRFGMQEGVDALLDAYEGPSVYQRPPQNPETLALLEALLTKSPGGMLQTTMDTASDIGNVLGSIGQLDKAEALGRQVRRTLPNIVNAVSSDVGGTYDAMKEALKQGVLDRGLGAVMGVEDVAIPGLSMMSKLGAAGTALGMAATPMGKRTREQLLKEIADAGSQAQANKIARPAIEEYGYDPVLVDALREKRDPSIFEKREGLSSGKENPAAKRREKMRGNPEFKQRLPQEVKGETIATPLDISQREIVQPESMVGNVAIGVPGDRSARTRIEQLGGVPLDEPIDVQGGPAYGFGRDDFSWASNYGIARGKQNHVITASEATGLPVLGIYTAMGEGAVDFSTPVVEMLMGQLNTIRVPVAARKKLDQKINETIQTVNKQRIAEGVKKGRPIEVIEDSLLDEFVGIDHPEAMAQLLGTTGASGKEYRRFGSGDLRKVVVQTIAREDMRGLGFPSYKDAAYQMTEPELRSVQRGDTGGAILRMDPDATLRDPDAPPDAGHRSYDTGIPGQYQGVMKQVDIPAPVMFPKTFDRYRTLKTKEGNPMELHSQMGKFHMGADFEVLDQQWLDGVRSYMERKGITDLGGVPTLAFLLLGAGGLNAMASDDPEMQAAGGAMMGAAAMGGVPKVIRQAGAGAKNAKKAREQQLKEYEDFDYPDAQESIRTQITTTKPTYIKANQYLDDQQAIGKTLDYGAGLGLSKEMLGYDMFEPNTARGEALGVTYDFTDSKAIPDSQYERVVNLNVLNVVSPQVRDFIVEDIARVMKPGGSAIITTRGRDVLSAKGTPGPEPMSLVTSTGTYQKGFTNPELKEYIETVLGEGYDVKSISLGGAGVYVKKKSNQVDIAKQASSGVRVPMPDKQLGVGKRVGYDYYVHKSAEDVVPNDVLSKAKEKIGDYEYDIVKYNNKDNSISFIESPDFDVADEPTVGKSIKVSADGKVSSPRKGGVTVYHHKWNMVRPDYIGFDYQDAIERSVRWTQKLESTGINRNKIGNKNYWETVIIPMLNNE
jgi:SAM-dependent methyltransferase